MGVESTGVDGRFRFRPHQSGRNAEVHANGSAGSGSGRHSRLSAFKTAVAQSRHHPAFAASRQLNGCYSNQATPKFKLGHSLRQVDRNHAPVILVEFDCRATAEHIRLQLFINFPHYPLVIRS